MPEDWSKLTFYDPHFATGFFDASTKKLHAPSVKQYEMPTSLLYKQSAQTDLDIAHMCPFGTPAICSPRDGYDTH